MQRVLYARDLGSTPSSPTLRRFQVRVLVGVLVVNMAVMM